MFLTKAEKETPTVIASVPNKILVSSLVALILVFGIYFGPLVDAAKSCLVILGL